MGHHGRAPLRRIVVLTPRYLSRVRAIGIESRTARSRALGAVVRALSEEDDLPGVFDAVALMPPTAGAFVRRVPGFNLWVWYTLRESGDGQELVIATLTEEPPVPLLD